MEYVAARLQRLGKVDEDRAGVAFVFELGLAEEDLVDVRALDADRAGCGCRP